MNSFTYLLICLLSCVSILNTHAQHEVNYAPIFTKADSLRGALRHERMYDVSFYELDIEIDIDNKSINRY